MEEARIDRKAIARALKDYAASAAVRPVLIGFDGYVDKAGQAQDLSGG